MRAVRFALSCVVSCGVLGWGCAQAQQPDVAAKLQELNQAIAKAQAQLEQSQHQLDELKEQMRALQQQIAANAATPAAAAPVAANGEAEKKQRAEEHEAMQDSQLATLQQA